MIYLSSFRRAAALTVVATFAVTCSVAELRPEPGSQPVDELFATSGLVIRGVVKQVSATGSAKGSWHGVPTMLTTYAAQIAVDKTYKGIPNSLVSLQYLRPEDRICAVSTCPRLEVGEFDYFFLPGNGPTYEFQDAYSSKFRASRLTESREKGGIDGLKRDFVSGLDDPDENVRLIQAELVGSSGRIVDAEALKRLLVSSDDLTRGTVYHALLRLGDYSILASMRQFLEAPSNVPDVERLRFLCLSQINVTSNAAAVESLLQLANSPASDLREVAIHALRTTESPKAVPLFVRALDDNVQMIRYDAVLALAQIKRNWQLAPAVDAFTANEKTYVNAWKTWWETEGKRDYGP